MQLLCGSGDRVGSCRLMGQRIEDAARSIAIDLHLSLQRLDTGEFTIGADELDKFDAEVLAIQVAIEIQQEYFEDRLAIIELRACPPIGGAKVRAPPDMHARGVDAVC